MNLFVTLLAQTSDNEVEVNLFALLFILIALGLTAAGQWALFNKAAEPGWAAVIPIFNSVVLLMVVGKPIWWVILYFVPFVNIVIRLIVAMDVAKSFGKGTAYGVGLAVLPFVFYPMLGFGDAEYQYPQQV